jgi:hypothetical protein
MALQKAIEPMIRFRRDPRSASHPNGTPMIV